MGFGQTASLWEGLEGSGVTGRSGGAVCGSMRMGGWGAKNSLVGAGVVGR